MVSPKLVMPRHGVALRYYRPLGKQRKKASVTRNAKRGVFRVSSAASIKRDRQTEHEESGHEGRAHANRTRTDGAVNRISREGLHHHWRATASDNN
jgi:hypothetical protein